MTTTSPDLFRAAIVASRGVRPLGTAHRAALKNPPPKGVTVDEVSSFRDGLTGGDLRVFGAWMLEKHDARIALFARIRAALRDRQPPPYHDVRRLIDDLRLEADAPDDLCAALGLAPSVTVEAVADRLQRKWAPPRRSRGYSDDESVMEIRCRDMEPPR
ncbi:hypothetical protein [Methylocystis sp.]|uniref:hypothetical protein n=1 Tax=Methylocystis sp. TaxID=1911079 RepID=UPI003DA4BF16